MTEAVILKSIMVAISKAGGCVLRVNAGMAWAGEIVKRTPDTITLRNPRPFHGVPEGVSDLLGYVPVVITQEMVGSTVAVFLSPEVKTQTGRKRELQIAWIDNVNRDGGRGGFARSVAEALAIMRVDRQP